MPTPPTYNSSVITAVAHVQQGLSLPRFLAGGQGGSGGSTYALFKKSTTCAYHMWRSQLFKLDERFNIRAIKFALTGPVAANQEISPVLGIDDGATIVVGTSITVANYPNSERFIQLGPDNFNFNVHGDKNFYLELRFYGTALIGVSVPITIEVETEER